MKKHYSLIHADKILALVKKEVRGIKSVDDKVVIEVWANCREQGYCIKANSHDYKTDIAICFAQQRSSDAIVVIAGPLRAFDNQTNQPSEKIWTEDRRHFSVDIEAAKFIARKIMMVVEPVATAIMES
jgi:hypothetical protein